METTFGFRCWYVEGREDLSCRLCRSCAGEARLSTGLLRYSRRAMYGSLPLSFDFDRILLHVCTDFSTSPFALGYIGLEVLSSIPQV